MPDSKSNPWGSRLIHEGLTTEYSTGLKLKLLQVQTQRWKTCCRVLIMYRKIYYLNLQYNLQHSLRIEEERNLFLGRNIDRTNSINLHELEILGGQFILNTNIL